VRLDDLELFRAEFARFEKDGVGDRDLADVVQRSREAEAFDRSAR
jgi:hypothetical protein